MNDQPFVPDKRVTMAALALVALAWVISLVALPMAPALIPTHWGVDGQPDRFSAPIPGLLLMPGIMTAIAALLHVLPRVDPRRQNYAAFGSAYMTIQLGILVFMLIIHILSVAAALGAQFNMTVVILPLVGVLLIVLGNLLGKLRPNWFVGIRTPWTLASSDVWTRTHRFGGRMMVAFGLVMIIAGFIPSPALSAILVVGGITIMAVSVIGYSYLVWRQLGGNHA